MLLNGKCINKDVAKMLKCPANSHPNSDLSACTCDTGFDSVGS